LNTKISLGNATTKKEIRYEKFNYSTKKRTTKMRLPRRR